MSSAFDPMRADFRNMVVSVKKKPYINKIMHKSYIDVDEAGTEAVAVTAVDMDATQSMEAPPPPPVIVDCNRPFFYLIQDNRNGATLFMGTLVDPRN
jgi:serpin B